MWKELLEERERFHQEQGVYPNVIVATRITAHRIQCELPTWVERHIDLTAGTGRVLGMRLVLSENEGDSFHVKYLSELLRLVRLAMSRYYQQTQGKVPNTIRVSPEMYLRMTAEIPVQYLHLDTKGGEWCVQGMRLITDETQHDFEVTHVDPERDISRRP